MAESLRLVLAQLDFLVGDVAGNAARMAAAQVQAMEETPTLIGLMRMAREPDVRRGLAFMLAMAGALGRQHAHDPIDYAAD